MNRIGKRGNPPHREESLFPDLDPLFPLGLKKLLFWRTEQLFNLGLRLTECILALREYGDVPTAAKTDSFIRRCGEGEKARFLDNAWRLVWRQA